MAEPWKLATTIGFTIPISGRLEVEQAKARLEQIAALAEVAEHEWRLRIEVRRTWTRWSGLVAKEERTALALADADRLLAIVGDLERVGEMPRVEANLLRVARASADAQRSLLAAEISDASFELRRLMGIAPTADLALQPEELNTVAPTPPHIDDASDRILERSPLLLVTKATYDVAERTLELAIRGQYPDLEIGPGYGREDGRDEVLLGLALPLPLFNANRRAIAEAVAARELARGRAEATLESLLHAYTAAEARVRSATDRRSALERDLLPLVERQYADLRELAAIGEFDPLIVLDVLERRREAEVLLLEALVDERLARIRIDELLGPDQGEPTGVRP